jgi:1-acyl-sn-glycerol-3-phosphate acyltransferase
VSDRTYRATIAVGRMAMRALDITVRVTGAERLPVTGPALLAANHASYPDFLFVGKGGVDRGRYIRFLSRHDVWEVPLIRRAMDHMQHVPVDREAPAAAYLKARRLLREGEIVCAFPEAGISWSYAVRALMPGAASLARETGLPVIPVAVWGGQRIWSVGRPVDGRKPRPDLTRGRVVDVSFADPVHVGPGDDLTRATQRLGASLTEALEELQLRPEHRPAPGEHAPWYPAHLGGHAPDRLETVGFDSVPRSAVAPTWGPLAEGPAA